jgi:Fis family transcriptional regulator
MSKKHIDDCIRDSLEQYFKDLRGTEPNALHDMIIAAVEKPMLDVVMRTPRATRARPPNGWASTATRCAASC